MFETETVRFSVIKVRRKLFYKFMSCMRQKGKKKSAVLQDELKEIYCLSAPQLLREI